MESNKIDNSKDQADNEKEDTGATEEVNKTIIKRLLLTEDDSTEGGF